MSSNIPLIETLQDAVILKPASGGAASAKPVVSVVTVCFNPLRNGREMLFAKNLDSVQQQTGVSVEHIIVDGASDGIALAQGKYVTFLNSDDFYHCPEGLALSVKALEKSRCTFSFAPIVPEGSRFGHRLHRHPEHHLHRILIFPTIPHQSMLYLRSALVELGGYDPTYLMGGDHDLTLRLIAARKKACFVNTAFVTFASGGFSTQNVALKLREKERRVRNFHREVFGVEFSDEEIETLVRRYRYPPRYLSVYVASQHLIRRTFVAGLPKTIRQSLVRHFNFWKYYLKCLLSI